MRYIFGPLLVVIGVLMMKYTVRITEEVGKVDFADKWLPAPFAGTYTWWRVVGLAAVAIGLLWMFGYLDFGVANIEVPTN